MERQTIDDMNIPGFRLHPLKGEEKGRWSIWVNGNWRLTFDILCKSSGKQRVYDQDADNHLAVIEIFGQ